MAQPLVSILIPTHKRPDYLSQALASARAQSYRNLEIIVSDNSGNDDSRAAVADQLRADPRVRYLSIPKCDYFQNWLNVMSQATGTYVNWLMDDDLFAPNKVERMVHYFETYPSVSLVTSFRQLIDEQGKPLPALPGTQRLFEEDTVMPGNQLAEHILRVGQNLVGEPTTAMYRRAEVGAGFGRFADKTYVVLSDLSTWLSLMPGRHVVYIPEALSSFRIHGGQDQRRPGLQLRANLEWLQLLLDSHENGLLFTDKPGLRQLLAQKLAILMPHLALQREVLRELDMDAEDILRLTRRAVRLLLQ
ncbi:MAG: glycosyltransferase family 2 protein [Paucibacter sp.]|nr:glycosyltransferase family 2 protein [Roseateles sp.]